MKEAQREPEFFMAEMSEFVALSWNPDYSFKACQYVTDFEFSFLDLIWEISYYIVVSAKGRVPSATCQVI